MYIGLSLRHSSITKRILRGGLNLEIGKTLRKTSRVIIVVVQTTTKEIVGRKRGTKRVELLTTRKMIPRQPHVMVISSSRAMMLVSV